MSAAVSTEGPVIVRRLADLDTFKIKDADTNYFSLIADPIRDKVPFMVFLEVFEPGGRTPGIITDTRTRCSSCSRARASRSAMARRFR